MGHRRPAARIAHCRVSGRRAALVSASLANCGPRLVKARQRRSAKRYQRETALRQFEYNTRSASVDFVFLIQQIRGSSPLPTSMAGDAAWGKLTAITPLAATRVPPPFESPHRQCPVALDKHPAGFTAPVYSLFLIAKRLLCAVLYVSCSCMLPHRGVAPTHHLHITSPHGPPVPSSPRYQPHLDSVTSSALGQWALGAVES